MRSSNKSRSRNKPGNNGHNGQNNNNNNQRRPMGNIVNRVFESAGPDGKVRGTPQQIIDKYQALARDAQLSGDRVAAENHLQHSEHYSRLLGEAQRQQSEQRFGQDRDEGGARGEDQSEIRGGGGPQGGGAPREHQQQGGGRDQRRPAQNFGLATFEPEDSDGEFGPIPTPESGDPQPRLSTPAVEYQPAEAMGGDPRDAAPVPAPAPVVEQVAPAPAEAPAPAAESRAPRARKTAPAPVPEAAPEAAAEGEPAAEAKPKRTRTRRKAKVEDAAPEGEAPAEGGAAEAQPVE
ncbi:MAG: DUF4167 domain-containing protein [Rhodovulum sulfidophilum]|uniref:DUF4167 domain-containing protein n=1 Tax=Rhodovulum sulfidophilum TaxID=35806 RepID=A0A2W5Q719_RHOSU|nr:MAG: DUF4167 domain-containing protein [Rhodovulum sulfidophilum]